MEGAGIKRASSTPDRTRISRTTNSKNGNAQGNAQPAFHLAPPRAVNGNAAPAVFTYATVNSYCCHSGNWDFDAVNFTAGPTVLNWTYSGYPGTCGAHVSLDVYVKRAGTTIFTQTVYINNRPEEARGRACQQPDGNWAIID